MINQQAVLIAVSAILVSGGNKQASTSSALTKGEDLRRLAWFSSCSGVRVLIPDQILG